MGKHDIGIIVYSLMPYQEPAKIRPVNLVAYALTAMA